MHDGPLDDPLEPESWLSIDIFIARKHRGIFSDEFAEILTQGIKVSRASSQDFRRCGIIQQGKQQVLYGNKFMSRRAGLDKGHMQADFKFFGDHATSNSYVERDKQIRQIPVLIL